MNAKCPKNDNYNDELQSADLEQFKSVLEEISQGIHDPRAQDNQRHSLSTLLSIIFGKVVIEKEADYVLMIKENQLTLHDEIQNYFNQAECVGFEGVSCDFFEKAEKGHGRKERREVYATDDIDWLPMKDEWSGLKSLVMVKSLRTIDGITSEERRYYI